MKFSNFMNSLLTDLIPSKIQVGQNFWLEIHVQIAVFLSTLDARDLMDSNKWELKI